MPRPSEHPAAACEQARLLMGLMVCDDPATAEEEKEFVRVHLMVCPACEQEYEETQELVRLVRRHCELGLNPEAVPDPLLSEGTAGGVEPFAAQPLDVQPFDVRAGLADLLQRVATIEDQQRPAAIAADAFDMRTTGVEAGTGRGAAVSTLAPAGRRWASSSPLRHRLFLRVALAACLALAVLLPGSPRPWRGAPDPGPSSVAGAVPTLEWLTPAARRPLQLGQPISSGEQVATVLLGGRHRVVLNRSTTVTVTASAGGHGGDPAWRVRMSSGELFADVKSPARFAVLTPNAVSEVTGTQFNVRASEGETELTLLEGGIRFSGSGGARVPVHVLTGHVSRVVGSSGPTKPQRTDALAASAWAKPWGSQRRVAATTDESSESLIGLAHVREQAVLPELPDYRAWSYARFRDEMRPWFARQFPWAMELEKELNGRHGITADYLDVLVVSGDVWQFHYPETQPGGVTIPVFHPGAVKRLARWYGVDADPLLSAAGQSGVRPRSDVEHGGKAFAAEIRQWQAEAARAVPQQRDELALFSLNAAAYLAHTRSAAYLWLGQHPDQARQLLATGGDYASTFVVPLLTAAAGHQAPPPAPAAQLLVQVEACRETYRQAFRLPPPEQCPTGEWDKLRNRFIASLSPLAPTDQTDQQRKSD